MQDTNSEDEEIDEDPAKLRGVTKFMAKRIKLLDDEVRIMSNAQLSMHKEIQQIVDKSVKKLERKSKSLRKHEDNIKNLKEDVNTISGHVCSYILWQNDAEEKLAIIPEIRDG